MVDGITGVKVFGWGTTDPFISRLWINTETSNINAAKYGFYVLELICICCFSSDLQGEEECERDFSPALCLVFCFTLDVISHCHFSVYRN